MVGRVFWFTVGAGVAVFVVVRARDLWRRTTPRAVGARVADTAGEVSGSVRDFTGRLRAAMAERETELRDTLGLPE